MTAVGVIPARYRGLALPGQATRADRGPQHDPARLARARARPRACARVIVATDDARIADACRALRRRGRDDARGSPDRHRPHRRGRGEALRRDRRERPGRRAADAGLRGRRGRRGAARGPRGPDRAPSCTPLDPARPRRSEPREGRARPRAAARSTSRAARSRTRATPTVRAPLWQHVGLYAYRRDFLLRFVGLPPTPAERAEWLEQLRALEHGHRDPLRDRRGLAQRRGRRARRRGAGGSRARSRG